MRVTLLKLLCGLALCVAATALTAHAQDAPQPATNDDDVQVRGAFLTTRPSAPEKKKPADPAPARERTNGSAPAKGASGQVAKNTPVAPPTKKSGGVKQTSERPAANANITLANFNPAAIGIGYTLFQRDLNGDARRVDPNHVFHRDDAIRISLEANTDGYLYVFYTENEGEPQMIFPDSRLGRGSNFIRAHVPYEVPSNMEADERLRWFVFDATPATEHLYIVVTREPLPNVPTGEALVGFCADPAHSCPWNPPRSLWAQLVKEQPREQVAVSKIKDEGHVQTPSEREATTRGLGLAADAPEPTVVRLNASSTTGLLITTLTLVHR
ncbi:MAG TPA: DUF4384 domain-containing protein [Pyrinomonadaceae bacterium]